MARSMTAFARTSLTVKGETWSVEVRSLNHRYFEFSLKMPSSYNELEPKVKDCVHHELRRGKVYVNISQTRAEESSASYSVDDKMAAFYVKAAKQLEKKYKLSGGLSAHRLLTLPKVVTAQSEEVDTAVAWKKIDKLLRDCLKQVAQAKTVEGKELVTDIKERLNLIASAADRIQKLSAGRSDQYLTKLQDRMRQILEGREIDDDRLLREAALLAEKTDITEEIVRLTSHLKLFHNKLVGEKEVGRELDFLCQEVNREINTIGSKCQYFDISQDVILMKKELEKIREQVQNIE